MSSQLPELLPHDSRYDGQVQELLQGCAREVVPAAYPEHASQVDVNAIVEKYGKYIKYGTNIYAVDVQRDEVVGNLALQVVFANHSGAAYLSQLFVVPEQRHRGVAGALMSQVRKVCLAHDHRHLQFDRVVPFEPVDADNEGNERNPCVIPCRPFSALAPCSTRAWGTEERKYSLRNGGKILVPHYNYLVSFDGESASSVVAPEGVRFHMQPGWQHFSGTRARNRGISQELLGDNDEVTGKCFGLPCTLKRVRKEGVEDLFQVRLSAPGIKGEHLDDADPDSLSLARNFNLKSAVADALYAGRETPPEKPKLTVFDALELFDSQADAQKRLELLKNAKRRGSWARGDCALLTEKDGYTFLYDYSDTGNALCATVSIDPEGFIRKYDLDYDEGRPHAQKKSGMAYVHGFNEFLEGCVF